jgi:hypothetical protein
VDDARVSATHNMYQTNLTIRHPDWVYGRDRQAYDCRVAALFRRVCHGHWQPLVRSRELVEYGWFCKF